MTEEIARDIQTSIALIATMAVVAGVVVFVSAGFVVRSIGQIAEHLWQLQEFLGGIRNAVQAVGCEIKERRKQEEKLYNQNDRIAELEQCESQLAAIRNQLGKE